MNNTTNTIETRTERISRRFKELMQIHHEGRCYLLNKILADLLTEELEILKQELKIELTKS